jgi:cytoskeletal protein CcmA (bactofilin family)
MFRRKEDGTEELIPENEHATTTASSNPAAPAYPTAVPAAPAAQQPAPNFRPTPPQAAMVAASRNPAPVAPSAPITPVAETRTAATPVNRPNAKRVLTVGPDIQMKGEISSCDRVVIEGMVDATMRDVHTVELAETGALKGTAEVEDAEISGSFEGDLVVRGKLTVYSAGRVRGNITYGEIEIQRGGQISGNIRNVAEAKGGQAFPAATKAKVA